MAKPRVVVFDLDACVWDPEMYQLWGGGSPFRYDAKTNECIDRSGERVRLLGAVQEVWTMLHSSPEWRDTQIAIASRCDEPRWAYEVLKLFRLKTGETLMETVPPQLCEIHKGSKQTHLRNIAKATGVALADMLFFDDDPYNIRDVSAIGVTSVLTPHGVTREAWNKGLAMFAQRQQQK